RTESKPVIVLIPSTEYLKLFDVYPKKKELKLLEHRGITVIIPLKNSKKFFYLHRGANSIAFRIPEKKELIELMESVKKPLIAPSANPEGKSPAKNIDEAIAYFGNSVDLYIDGGEMKNSIPSTISQDKTLRFR
ncbi:MAG: Sua5/YciO/YrdC/YwlC family protein, partial [Persephonella sp.]|nr:Sua5/YciO/YrdC/YwlC family protein [Persephonella sp.]